MTQFGHCYFQCVYIIITSLLSPIIIIGHNNMSNVIIFPWSITFHIRLPNVIMFLYSIVFHIRLHDNISMFDGLHWIGLLLLCHYSLASSLLSFTCFVLQILLCHLVNVRFLRMLLLFTITLSCRCCCG